MKSMRFHSLYTTKWYLSSFILIEFVIYFLNSSPIILIFNLTDTISNCQNTYCYPEHFWLFINTFYNMTPQYDGNLRFSQKPKVWGVFLTKLNKPITLGLTW